MNYEKIYKSLIQKRKNNPIINNYCEIHHILPRCLGGTNHKSNLVTLTAREHFVAHYLLVKMHKRGTNEWYKTNHAFMFMKSTSITHNRYFNSRLYDALRINFSKLMSMVQSGKNNSQYGKCWIFNKKSKQSKSIDKKLLNEYLDKGWKKGRILNFNKDEEGIKRRKNERRNKRRKEQGRLNRKQSSNIKRIPKSKSKFTKEERRIQKYENALSLLIEFINSKHSAIRAFAKEKGRTDPAIIYLWKNHLPFYGELFSERRPTDKEHIKKILNQWKVNLSGIETDC